MKLAHDLNNHITALLSFCDIVLDELPSQHALRARIESIRSIGQFAVMRSAPDAARLAQVTEQVTQLRPLAYRALADVTDTRSPVYADVLEIAMAVEAAIAVVNRPNVPAAA